MAEFIQPKRNSAVITPKPFSYEGASEIFTKPLKEVTGFLADQREQNTAFVDSIQDEIATYDPEEVARLAPDVDDFMNKYTDASSKFNMSIANPRNAKERQIKAEFDKKARELRSELKAASIMNPMYEKNRQAVLAEPGKYSSATVDFYKDKENYYKLKPLDRNIPEVEIMSDIQGSVDDILGKRIVEKSYPTDPDENGIIRNISESYLYKTDAQKEQLIKDIATDKTLEDSFKQHFREYLYENDDLDILTNSGTEDGKAIYEQEFMKFKRMVARERAEALNKVDRSSRYAGQVRKPNGDGNEFETAAGQFYKSLAGIMDPNSDLYEPQDPKAGIVVKDPKTGQELMVSNAFTGYELSDGTTVDKFYINPITKEVSYIKKSEPNSYGEVAMSEPIIIKDPYNQFAQQHIGTLNSLTERAAYDKFARDNGLMNENNVFDLTGLLKYGQEGKSKKAAAAAAVTVKAQANAVAKQDIFDKLDAAEADTEMWTLTDKELDLSDVNITYQVKDKEGGLAKNHEGVKIEVDYEKGDPNQYSLVNKDGTKLLKFVSIDELKQALDKNAIIVNTGVVTPGEGESESESESEGSGIGKGGLNPE